jgi:diguanylate cyclase (GGDEF)-like protein
VSVAKTPHILIAGGSPESVESIEQGLKSSGCRSFAEFDLDRIVDVVDAEAPDLVLLDVRDGGRDGFELLRMLRARLREGFVPIIIVTAKEDTDGIMKGFEAGADDYITEPFNVEEMIARVKSMLRIKMLQDELQNANLRLRQLSIRDGLTGLFNRRYFYERLAIELERARRHQQPLSCIMTDVDRFKAVNDEYGHIFGDYALRKLAAVLSEVTRKIDIVSRYGGEEFVFLLPNTNLEQAAHLAERVRKRVEEEVFREGDVQVTLTISLGVSVANPGMMGNPDEFVKRADMACYEAKRLGRNKVAVWDPEVKSARTL